MKKIKLNHLPHNYQYDCANFMFRINNSGCFFDCGEGKTLVSLMVVTKSKRIKKENFTGALIVTTKQILEHDVWPKEIKNFGFKLTSTNLYGKDRDKELSKKYDTYVTNYDSLEWLYDNYKKIKANILILDESSYIKSSSSGRFKMLKKMRDKFDRIIILTATPDTQSHEDLFSQLYMLDGGERLGRFITQFRTKYYHTYMAGNDRRSWPVRSLKEGAEDDIFDCIKDIIYKTDEDHLKIPKEIYNDIIITLPDKVRKKYNKLEDEFITLLDDGVITAVNAGVKRAKLKQFCNGQVYDKNKKPIFAHDEKIKAVSELVDQLNGKPVLIGYEYKHDLLALKKVFPDAPFFGTDLSGKKPGKKDKLKIEAKWNSGKIPVLLGQVASVAHGLNLQKSGHNLICFGHLDRLELVIQFLGRIRRQGQKKRVIVHRLIVENSVDEDVILNQNRKLKGLKALLNAMRKRIRTR